MRFGMHKEGPDWRFRWSGPKIAVPPAGEPGHGNGKAHKSNGLSW
jgi:hypothetical protein